MPLVRLSARASRPDAAKELGKRASALQDRLAPSGTKLLHSAAADAVQAAGERAVDYAAVRVGDSDVGKKADATLARGVDRARVFARQHPLGAVVVVALAAAFVEVEFGVGVLAGLGTAALLVTRDGAATRRLVAAGGQRALASARLAYGKQHGLSRKSTVDLVSGA